MATDAVEGISQDIVVDVDAPGPPISVPDSGDTGEGGKLKMIVALVKKSLGVKDIAAMSVHFRLLYHCSFYACMGQATIIASIITGTDTKSRVLALLG